jgi:thioester reductase-like protein
VLDLAERCPALRRFHHVSTCYVSGRRAGRVREGDLEHGAGFHNAYEETKYLAELLVRERMRAGLAATVYRPAIAVGDSRTGETQKFDGPYFVIRWLLKQPRVAVLPIVGDPIAHRLNVVPRDWLVDAIATLAGRESTRGSVYQLADPEPLTVDAALVVLARATRRRIVRVPMPLRAAKLAIEHLPGVNELMGIPSAAIDYFVHPAEYDTTAAQAELAGSVGRPPRFDAYAEQLVAFVREHPELDAGPMS